MLLSKFQSLGPDSIQMAGKTLTRNNTFTATTPAWVGFHHGCAVDKIFDKCGAENSTPLAIVQILGQNAMTSRLSREMTPAAWSTYA